MGQIPAFHRTYFLLCLVFDTAPESTVVDAVIGSCSASTAQCVELPVDTSSHILAAPSVSCPSGSSEQDVLLDEVLLLLREKHSQFGSTMSGLQTMKKRLRRVHSSNQWESFLHTIGSAIPLAHRHRAAIHVQPTAVNRRRPGVTRGTKRLPTGRPAKGDKRAPPKRRRNLQLNVSANQPNAKSHGSGH